MSSFPLIEIALSLALMYLLLSVLVSGFGELWATVSHKRSRMLKEAVHRALVGDLGEGEEKLIFDYIRKSAMDLRPSSGGFTAKFAKAMSFGRFKDPRFPTYIPPKLFGKAIVSFYLNWTQNGVDQTAPVDHLFDINSPDSLKQFQHQFCAQRDFVLRSLEDRKEETDLPPIYALIEGMIRNCKNVADLQKELADWFFEYGESISYDYKRDMRWPLFISAGMISVLLNVDTVHVVKTLWEDDPLRAAVSSQAESLDLNQFATVYLDSTNQDPAKYDNFAQSMHKLYGPRKDLAKLKLPMGWDRCEDHEICPYKDTLEYVFTHSKTDPFGAFRSEVLQTEAENLTVELVDIGEEIIKLEFASPPRKKQTDEQADARNQADPDGILNLEEEEMPSEEELFDLSRGKNLDLTKFYPDELEEVADSFMRDTLNESLIWEIMAAPPRDTLVHKYAHGGKSSPIKIDTAQKSKRNKKWMALNLPTTTAPEPMLTEDSTGLHLEFYQTPEMKQGDFLLSAQLSEINADSIHITTFIEAAPYGGFWSTGFEVFKRNCMEITFAQMLGWFLTAFAASFGAPFWFDMLKRLINIKSGGKSKKDEE